MYFIFSEGSFTHTKPSLFIDVCRGSLLWIVLTAEPSRSCTMTTWWLLPSFVPVSYAVFLHNYLTTPNTSILLFLAVLQLPLCAITTQLVSYVSTSWTILRFSYFPIQLQLEWCEWFELIHSHRSHFFIDDAFNWMWPWRCLIVAIWGSIGVIIHLMCWVTTFSWTCSYRLSFSQII